MCTARPPQSECTKEQLVSRAPEVHDSRRAALTHGTDVLVAGVPARGGAGSRHRRRVRRREPQRERLPGRRRRATRRSRRSDAGGSDGQCLFCSEAGDGNIVWSDFPATPILDDPDGGDCGAGGVGDALRSTRAGSAVGRPVPARARGGLALSAELAAPALRVGRGERREPLRAARPRREPDRTTSSSTRRRRSGRCRRRCGPCSAATRTTCR